MKDPQHEPFNGMAALYTMGALSEDERPAFETHLAVCRECVNEVTSLLPVTHVLVHGIPPLEAPAALRARVLDKVTGALPAFRETREPGSTAHDIPFSALDEPEMPAHFVKPPRKRSGVLFWLASTLLVVAAVTGGWYLVELDREIQSLRADLDTAARLTERTEVAVEAARAAATEREAMLAIVSDPDVQQLELTGQPLSPRASARALWNNATDMVFLATGLPALPAGDVYQLWFVLPDAPTSAALVEPDPAGDATVLLEVPGIVTLPTAMAVTVEPVGGVDAPTGDVYLLGQPAE